MAQGQGDGWEDSAQAWIAHMGEAGDFGRQFVLDAPMLARVLGQMKYGGSVAAVGLAGGVSLPASVIPLLLRGVNLLGIDSVTVPYERRVKAWARVVTDLPMAKLEAMVRTAGLGELPALGEAILKGGVQGRVVVDVNA